MSGLSWSVRPVRRVHAIHLSLLVVHYCRLLHAHHLMMLGPKTLVHAWMVLRGTSVGRGGCRNAVRVAWLVLVLGRGEEGVRAASTGATATWHRGQRWWW